jgi:hypothetical protein
LQPAVAISVEGVMAEALLTWLGTGWYAFMASCIACALEGIPHFFIMSRIVYGEGIFDSYVEVARKFQTSLGLAESPLKYILALWVAGHLAAGIVCGLLAISVGNYVRRK